MNDLEIPKYPAGGGRPRKIPELGGVREDQVPAQLPTKEPEEPEGDTDEGRTRGQDREQACGKIEEPHTGRDCER